MKTFYLAALVGLVFGASLHQPKFPRRCVCSSHVCRPAALAGNSGRTAQIYIIQFFKISALVGLPLFVSHNLTASGAFVGVLTNNRSLNQLSDLNCKINPALQGNHHFLIEFLLVGIYFLEEHCMKFNENVLYLDLR